jgi:hypothetical protein
MHFVLTNVKPSIPPKEKKKSQIIWVKIERILKYHHVLIGSNDNPSTLRLFFITMTDGHR